MVTKTLTSLAEKITVGTDVAQVSTVTLTGTSGTATITGPGGLTSTVTFNTTLTQTATDFDTDESAAYTAEGITVTTSGDDIIFTAAVAGVGFDIPVITNATGDLDGTVVETTDNNSVAGEIDFMDVLPFKSVAGLTGYALIELVSGTSVQFSPLGAVTATSIAATANEDKLIIPIYKDKPLNYEGGAGSETFNIVIVPPDFKM